MMSANREGSDSRARLSQRARQMRSQIMMIRAALRTPPPPAPTQGQVSMRLNEMFPGPARYVITAAGLLVPVAPAPMPFDEPLQGQQPEAPFPFEAPVAEIPAQGPAGPLPFVEEVAPIPGPVDYNDNIIAVAEHLQGPQRNNHGMRSCRKFIIILGLIVFATLAIVGITEHYGIHICTTHDSFLDEMTLLSSIWKIFNVSIRR